MLSGSAPLRFTLGTGYQSTAFSPPLSDLHFQSAIITMRTSAIIAFICLAPSFSLPSISVRAYPSKRPESPDGHGQVTRGTFQQNRDRYSSHPIRLATLFGPENPVGVRCISTT
ncbi:hypothetical protein F5148DRAFT_1379195 [Russula earlei]|uniref:Uncharacterized protein n=1 Tax=Russula earlei TaxID=71964 RepID=A0ACC0TW53_9AGAM|nr:hypothetical protein F5148DRAFT_1379195 [Russula earlei]